jgi:hypothetical protein
LSCQTPGIAGDVPASNAGGPTPFNTIAGKGNLNDCRKLCYSLDNYQCRSFAIRTNAASGGACYLYDTDITPSVKAKTGTTYVYYPLPAGIQGWVPENVAQHYTADVTKTKGTYAACRQFCLSQAQCEGFGYKNGGDCQLYNVSLVGKVKATTDSPYIQYQMDCARI